MLDTTGEHEMRLALLNKSREIEVEITRSPLPKHGDPIQGSLEEQKQIMTEAGAQITYVAPQIDPQMKNWYVISGYAPDGRIRYIRRWYTHDGITSIIFRYDPAVKALYDKIIVDMTLRGMEFSDPSHEK